MSQTRVTLTAVHAASEEDLDVATGIATALLLAAGCEEPLYDPVAGPVVDLLADACAGAVPGLDRGAVMRVLCNDLGLWCDVVCR